MDDRTKELIAIGCSVTANCHPCVTHHVNQARVLGLEDEAINQAVRIGLMVRKGAAGEMDNLLKTLTGVNHTDRPG